MPRPGERGPFMAHADLESGLVRAVLMGSENPVLGPPEPVGQQCERDRILRAGGAAADRGWLTLTLRRSERRAIVACARAAF